MTRRNKGEKTIMSKTKKPEASKKVCLRDGCGRARSARGLCVVDYRAARRLIGVGKIRWQELEAMGCALPAGPRGRVSAMQEWIATKSEKKS